MKRKIKFPLIMGDGIEVRTIEELIDSFNFRIVVNYYFNGKLQRWLRDRNYDKELKSIMNLNIDSSNFNECLFKSLGVNYDEYNNDDIEYIENLKYINQIQYKVTGRYIDEEDITKNIFKGIKLFLNIFNSREI